MLKNFGVKNTRVLKLTAALLAAGTVLSPVSTQAEPITIALFGSAFASTFMGTIVSTLIGAAISWAGATIINWLFPPETPKEQERDPMEVSYGERVSRSAFVGVMPIAGHWVHANEYNESKTLQLVYILADGWISEVTGIMVNGRPYGLHHYPPTSNATQELHVDTFGDLINVRIHDGRPGQLADTDLVANTPDWDSTKKYAGMAYAVVTIISDKEKFNGIPEFVFISEGLKCYDPRKDTTVGGSGSHRFNDPSTWEFTKNPAVQAYHYCRGFYVNGFRVLGVGYSGSMLDLTTFVTAMNVCDETVEDPNGSNRKRYECNLQFTDADSFGAVMDRFCAAMGGNYAELQGRISIYAGKAQSSVLTITDDDLIDDEDIVFDDKQPGEALFSGIQGTYTHSTEYTAVPYEALTPSEFVYTGMEPRIAAINFPQVQIKHQAYLLAKMQLFDVQMQGTASISLDIKDIQVHINDWITWTSALPMIGTRVWKVKAVRYNYTTMRMRLDLKETDADVYDDNSTAADIIEPNRPFEPGDYLQTPLFFAVAATSVQSSDGTNKIPALKFTYTSIDDPAVLGVRIQYARADDTGDTKNVEDLTPTDGFYLSTDGVAPKTIYRARAQLIGKAGREYPWTDWVVSNDPTSALVGEVDFDLYEGVIGFDQLEDDIREYQNWISDGTRQLLEEAHLNSMLTVSQNLGNYNQIQTTKREIRLTEAQITAAYTEAITVAVGPNSAIVQRLEEIEIEFGDDLASAVNLLNAQINTVDNQVTIVANQVTSLSATVNGVSADASFRMEVYASPSGYSSRIGMEARISGSGSYRPASLFLDVPNSSSSPTRVTVVADQFVVSSYAGSNSPVNPFIVQFGVVYINNARIRNLTGDNIQVNSINASQYLLNGTIITDKIGANQISGATMSAVSGVFFLNGVERNAVNPVYSGALGDYSGNTNLIIVTFDYRTAGMNASYNGTAEVKLFEGGNMLRRKTFLIDDNFNGAATITYMHTNPPANAAYRLTGRIDGGGGGCMLDQCQITILRVNR